MQVIGLEQAAIQLLRSPWLLAAQISLAELLRAFDDNEAPFGVAVCCR